MTKFLTFLCLLCLIGTAFAAPQIKSAAPNGVRLAWTSSPQANIVHYRVYYGTMSGARMQYVEVGNVTTADVLNLTGGVTYYFVATAINEAGMESEPSDELVYVMPTPPDPPTGLHVVTIVLQASTDLQHWDTFAVVAHAPENPNAEFYRLLIGR